LYEFANLLEGGLVTDTPSTLFSGTTKPEGDLTGPEHVIGLIATYILAVILLPVAVVVYAIWLALFTYARLPWWMPAPFAGVFTLVALVMGKISPNGIMQIIDSWKTAISAIGTKSSVISIFGHMLMSQMVLCLWGGTVWALCVMTWRWKRIPKWQEHNIVPGPVLKRRLRTTQANIEAGIESPSDGITLGVSRDLRDPRFSSGKPGAPYGERVVIADSEAIGHLLVAGGSGSGKTSSMLVGMRDIIRMGRGLVVIDCKGGPDVPLEIANWCERNGREFLHWSIHDANIPYNGPAEGPAFYDPISRGTPSRRKDLLMGSQKWDVEFYKQIVANYIQTLFGVMDLVPALEGVDTFSDLADLLSPAQLLARARHISAEDQPELAATLTRVPSISKEALSAIGAMYGRIQTLTSSTAGAWLRKDPEGLRDINLRKVADEGQVVVFSLDSSNYEDTVNLIAGLIIQDLKTLSSELRHDPAPAPLHIYIDEFSSIDTTNILGLLAKARDAAMPVTLATQALADLARRESTFVDQVLGIVSAFVIHRANTETDAKIFAGLSGVVRKRVERLSIEQASGSFGTMGVAAATGKGFVEERDEHAVHAGVFQHLPLGYCIYIAKSPHARFVNPVQVIRENDGVASIKSDNPVEINRNARFRPEPIERITYPHPAIVEQLRLVKPTSSAPSVETHQVDDNGETVKRAPRRPTGTTNAQGKAAGAPVALPPKAVSSSATPSAPMLTASESFTEIDDADSDNSEEWKMP
jgi:hypothetical protein